MARTKTVGLLVIASVVVTGAYGASDVDTSTPYVWGQNIGWCNAYADDNGLAMTPDVLSGYVWCQNIGWINLGDGSPETPPPLHERQCF